MKSVLFPTCTALLLAMAPTVAKGQGSPPPQEMQAPPEAIGGVFESESVLPAPVDPETSAAAFPLPTSPVEPYLLTSEAGPFMVTAHVFRGDYAVKKAQALAMEIRAEHRLPAYVYFIKIKPGNSNIRGIPPTSDRAINEAIINPPESERVIDEAAVLVGDCPTIDHADDLRDRVKKIRPRCMGQEQSIFFWRNGKGLERAFITTNPLARAEDLYPGRARHGAPSAVPIGATVDPAVLRSRFVKPPDEMVTRMNRRAKHSIYDCPAPYTLVVAEYSGRSILTSQEDDQSKRFFGTNVLDQSPLRTAQDDAERMADQLAKNPTVRSMGLRPYVYHDRSASRVMLGDFNSPQDPKVDQVRQAAMTIEVETKRERVDGTLNIHRLNLAPAANVFEVPRPE